MAYNRPPYLAWFNSWRQQRCLIPSEWDELCRYTEAHPEISALLVFPGIWKGAATPECRRQWDERFGAPQGQASMKLGISRDGAGTDPTPVLWYQPKCGKGK
jgi:hypothetical protein